MKSNDTIIDMIGDADCRAILKSTSKKFKTTEQIIKETKIAQTSAYRKIIILTKANLLQVIIPKNRTIKDKEFKANTDKIKYQLMGLVCFL